MNARPPWSHIARASREERRRRARTHACNRAWPYARARCAAPPHHCQKLCDKAKHDVLTMYFRPNIALFLSHDPPPIPPATPRATNSSDPPRSSLLQPTTPPRRSKVQALFSLVLSQPPARGARRSQATLRITNGIGWQSSSGIDRPRREDGRRATSGALGRAATVRMVPSREFLPHHPEHRDEGVSATSHPALARPPRRSLLLLDTRGPRKGVLHTGRLPLARPWPPSGRVLHTGRTRTANPLPPLGGGLAHGPANYACLPVAASSGLAYGSPCPPLGGLAHGPATERRRTTTKRCCAFTRAQSRRHRSMMGYGRTRGSPRQRGGLLSPPMRAWLKQPHGRRHKAPPQPCALTTYLGRY